jgi:hypothetical protein
MERSQVPRPVDRVRGQTGIAGEDRLIAAGSAIADFDRQSLDPPALRMNVKSYAPDKVRLGKTVGSEQNRCRKYR